MTKKIILISGHGYNDPGAVSGKFTERDFIREHIVDTVGKYLKLAGHKVSIYGKNQDMYQDTAYGMSIGDTKNYGIYWVKEQGFDIAVEFHLDASTDKSVDGGHVIIAAGLEADEIDKGIQAAIEKHVDTIHGISKREDLAHTRIAKEIGLNYRLVELGFITNKGDMDYLIKHGISFCKDIADAINCKEIEIESKTKPAVKKKAVSKSIYTVKSGDTLWKIANQYGLTVKQLMTLNDLRTDDIDVGDKLKIRKSNKRKVNIKKAPVKKQVKNMRTKAEAIAYAKSFKGKGYDYDGWAGWQCFDLANVYWHYMFNHGLKGKGAKDIPTWNDFTGEAVVYQNTPEFLPQPGDVAVWGSPFGNGWGHVAIVLEANMDRFYAVEQNWFNGGTNFKETASERWKDYDLNMWFIRPLYIK